jgi:dephospho-CoA kinase
MHTAYSTVIVVYVPEEVQVHRLMERGHLSLSEAQTRIDAQMPLSEKVIYATHVIRNDESLDKTREQVIAVYQHLC